MKQNQFGWVGCFLCRQQPFSNANVTNEAQKIAFATETIDFLYAICQ